MGHFLFLEPFYGGSHKYFVDGLIEHSEHSFDLHTLPAHYWKWRMRGASLFFADKIKDLSVYDGIIVSNMLSLSDLKALWGILSIPYILYFHENQILYPLSDGEREDLHYGFTDITSSLAADFIIFNSHYHKKAYLHSLKPFISRLPDNKPFWVIDKIKEKCSVLYPGCHLPEKSKKCRNKPDIPLMIWNHRWEHDKNPEDFFSALFEIQNKGFDFRLAILGEQYNRSPAIFKKAKEELKDKIIHFGFAENKKAYWDLLNLGDIIISTSYQENFGISVVEAIGGGCFPLLPDRLSYRELIPAEYHKLCIYKNQNDLVKKLIILISRYDVLMTEDIRLKNERFSWINMINNYDFFLNNIKEHPDLNRDALS